MKIAVKTIEGGSAGEIDLADTVFAVPVRKDILQRCVVWQLSRRQQGTHKTKGRSEVTATAKKMYAQKGTGRARAGSIRSPIWRGGGATFAARPQNHEQKLNKKMYRAALRSILAELVRSERLVVVPDFAVDTPKTKALVGKLNGLGLNDVLIVSDAVDQNLYLAARNLPNVDVRDVQGSDPVSLIAYDKVLITVSAVKKFEELLA